MSLQVWNSLLERQKLENMVRATCIFILADEECSVSSLDTDSNVSDSSLSSADSTVGELMMEILRYSTYLMTPIGDPTIVWGRQVTIDNMADSTCLDQFRFRKSDLKHISNLLWDKMQIHLEGTKPSIRCRNRYICSFETGLLVILFCLSRP